MNVFLDTSALVKLYHDEEGTTELMAILTRGIDEIWLSELAMLEFRSALWKKVRTGELPKSDAVRVVECFENDQNKFRWVRLDPSVILQASALLMKYGGKGLRTLDSIQLATALHLQSPNLLCLTSDTLLRSFFQDENLATG
jgi:uncharacterized protein